MFCFTQNYNKPYKNETDEILQTVKLVVRTATFDNYSKIIRVTISQFTKFIFVRVFQMVWVYERSGEKFTT